MSDHLLTEAVWWCGSALEVAVLWRAIRGFFFNKYPVFYFYLAFVFVHDVAAYCIYTFRPNFYAKFYWSTEYVFIAIGYCVIWEIYRQIFKPYPGASRMTRSLLLAILIFVVCKVTVNAIQGGMVWDPLHQAPEFERSLRIVQGALLITIVAFIAYYSIPVGRNLKGMILGYGLYIGLTITQLGLHSYLGGWFQPIWKHLGWVSYTAALITWCATLWSYHPNPKPANDQPEYDFEYLASHTSRMMAQVRSGISRAMRP